MSVLIRGMQMPERCLNCHMYDNYNYYCKLYAFGIPARYNHDGSKRPEWCELVEIPETHGRLVDIDKLFARLNDSDCDMSCGDVARECTIIEAEGAEE